MSKSLHSSLECPDRLADRLEAHRLGVAAMSALALAAAMFLGNQASVRLEESAEHRDSATEGQVRTIASADPTKGTLDPDEPAFEQTSADWRGEHNRLTNTGGVASARFSVHLADRPR